MKIGRRMFLWFFVSFNVKNVIINHRLKVDKNLYGLAPQSQQIINEILFSPVSYHHLLLEGDGIIVPDGELLGDPAGLGGVGEAHHNAVDYVRDVRRQDRPQGPLRDGSPRIFQVS